MGLTSAQKNHFQETGSLIIPNFMPEETCDSLIERMQLLIENFDPGIYKTVFSTKDQRHAKDMYFMESGDKIRFFFEENAFNEQGDLKFEKSRCINKVGHALHELDPVFHSFSHSPLLAKLVDDIGISNPLLVQSMYICKQPFIGGEVTCHQDSTYLYAEEKPVLGLWFALQDATLENGCLWSIPGAHKTPLKSRMRRDKNNKISVDIYDKNPWPLDQMVPLPVSRGSVILLHGLLPHMSKENKSSRSRHAYTLHVVSGDSTYADDNWLQPSKELPFKGFDI